MKPLRIQFAGPSGVGKICTRNRKFVDIWKSIY